MAVGGPGTCALRALARVTGSPAGRRGDVAAAGGGDGRLGVPEPVQPAGGHCSHPRHRRRRALLAPGRRALRRRQPPSGPGRVRPRPARGPRPSGPVPPADRRGRSGGHRPRAVAPDSHPASRRDPPRDNGQVGFEQQGMRGRFALRFQSEENDTGRATRPEQVREAFNSPFWPFVLATTSVGQEGLDFHHYCHAVVHWNLPANPVDLEQREGRVHRYKGHAIRKNVARSFHDTDLSAHQRSVGGTVPGRRSQPGRWASARSSRSGCTRRRRGQDRAPRSLPAAEPGPAAAWTGSGSHWRCTGWSSASPARKTCWPTCLSACRRNELTRSCDRPAST